MPNCQNCQDKCPKAEMAHEAAKGRMYATNEFIALLKKVESGQLVEVVRCRDCKYWKPSGSKAGNSVSDMEYIGGCKFANYCRRESDFCSYGERKYGDWNG